MSASEVQLRADIVEVGRRLYARGYTASNDGNISVRLDAGRLLMTPTSVCKGFMTPDMMCITDLEGRKLAGERGPSSESLMHLEVYRQRPDAQAVVHAHPPTATGFAVAGIPLTRAVLAEVVTTLGSIPIASARRRHDRAAGTVRKCEGARRHALASHGALAKRDLFGAYQDKTIEHFAQISLVARMLGGEQLLTQQEVKRLQGCATYGIKAPAPICPEPSNADQAECQVLEAPVVPGRQLVDDDRLAGPRRGSAGRQRPMGADEEIRLTYRELTALIEDAVRNLTSS